MAMHQPRSRVVSDESNDQISTWNDSCNVSARRVDVVQDRGSGRISTRTLTQDPEIMAVKMQRVTGTWSSSSNEVRDPGVGLGQSKDVVVSGEDGFVLVIHQDSWVRPVSLECPTVDCPCSACPGRDCDVLKSRGHRIHSEVGDKGSEGLVETG